MPWILSWAPLLHRQPKVSCSQGFPGASYLLHPTGDDATVRDSSPDLPCTPDWERPAACLVSPLISDAPNPVDPKQPLPSLCLPSSPLLLFSGIASIPVTQARDQVIPDPSLLPTALHANSMACSPPPGRGASIGPYPETEKVRCGDMKRFTQGHLVRKWPPQTLTPEPGSRVHALIH